MSLFPEPDPPAQFRRGEHFAASELMNRPAEPSFASGRFRADPHPALRPYVVEYWAFARNLAAMGGFTITPDCFGELICCADDIFAVGAGGKREAAALFHRRLAERPDTDRITRRRPLYGRPPLSLGARPDLQHIGERRSVIAGGPTRPDSSATGSESRLTWSCAVNGNNWQGCLMKC